MAHEASPPENSTSLVRTCPRCSLNRAMMNVLAVAASAHQQADKQICTEPRPLGRAAHTGTGTPGNGRDAVEVFSQTDILEQASEV